MLIETSRFGSVRIEPEDILLFPGGLFAFSHLRHWVLLADAENDSIGWLHCVSDPHVAMAVVSPRKFVPDYQVRVARSHIATLELSAATAAYVLSIVSRTGKDLTINLRAPLIINLERRLGRQVITSDEQPLQHPIAELSTHMLRKSA